MIDKSRSSYVTRNTILELLSEREVAAVATAETAAELASGDEYVDLAKIEKGVLRSNGAKVEMGTVLPRKSVREETWEKVIAHLKAQRIEDVVAEVTKPAGKRKPS